MTEIVSKLYNAVPIFCAVIAVLVAGIFFLVVGTIYSEMSATKKK